VKNELILVTFGTQNA